MYQDRNSVDKSRCRCGVSFEPQDRFCRKCGTRRGDAYYTPRMESMTCIYGPAPVLRLHECRKCGHTYKVALMIDDYKYCPRCGGRTITVDPIRAQEVL